MNFDIYIIGGGEKMVDFLNGVAMYANTNGISLTAAIAFSIGIFWMMSAAAIQKIKMTDLYSYIFLTMMFVSVVINVKVDTYVYDPVNPMVTGRKVSNVPLGAAFITSLSTKLDYSITSGVEAIFTTPDDLKYSRSGMLMGQDMVVKSTQVTISDQAFKRNLDSFIQQCVIYDIRFNHYSFDDVLGSDDIWDFFLNNANTKSRAFVYDGNYVTCFEGVTKLNEKWNGPFMDNELMKFAKKQFPSYGESEARAMVLSMLPVSYDAIVGVSESAANILRQNMMINMYYNAINSFNMTADSTTASQAYIEARTDLQTINTNIISGQQNGKWLIYMKTTFLLILVGLFVLMAPFATLPGGFKKFINAYAGLFFMVCMWGPIFAFINYITVSDSIEQTSAIAGNGLTALSQNGISIINSRIAANAASFFGYVPYLSILLTGIGGGMASLLQSGLSASGRAAAAVANDVTMGTINLGTTSQGVHGYNSLSANKFDTSGSFRGDGTFSYTTGSGNQITTFGDGGMAVKTSSSYSQLDSAGISSRESLSQSLTNEGNKLTTSANKESREFSQRNSEVVSGGIQNSLNRFDHRANGKSWNYGEDSRESEAARYVSNVAQKMAKTFNISEGDARTQIASAFANGKFDSGKLLFGLGGSAGATVEFGMGVQGQKISNKSETDVKQWVKDNVSSEEMSRNLETVFSASRGQNITENNGQGIDGRTTYGEAFDYTKTRMDSAGADLQRAQSYRQAAGEMANTAFDVSRNYQSVFTDWLRNEKKLSANDIDQLVTSRNMEKINPYTNEFMSQQSEKIFNEWKERQATLGKNFTTPESSNEVETNYRNSNVSNVDVTPRINSAKSTTNDANNLQYQPNNVKENVENGLTGSANAVTTQANKIPQPSTPQSEFVKTPPTHTGYGLYVMTQVVEKDAVLQNSEPTNKNFNLRDTVLGENQQTEQPQPQPQSQPSSLVSTTAAAASMPVFSSILDFTKQNAAGAAEQAGSYAQNDVRDLQNQVASLQGQQGGEFDVFKGLNDTSNIPSIPTDINDGKPLIDINTNSLKQ